MDGGEDNDAENDQKDDDDVNNHHDDPLPILSSMCDTPYAHILFPLDITQ